MEKQRKAKEEGKKKEQRKRNYGNELHNRRKNKK